MGTISASALRYDDARKHFSAALIEAKRVVSIRAGDLNELVKILSATNEMALCLIDAQERFLVGNYREAQKNLLSADAKILRALKEFGESGRSSCDRLWVSWAERLLMWSFLRFCMTSSLINMVAGPSLETHLSIDFLRGKEKTFLALRAEGWSMRDDSLLADFAEAVGLVLQGSILSLRAHQAMSAYRFDEATDLFKEAKSALWGASKAIPDAVPMADRLKEACYHWAASRSQAERYAEMIRSYSEKVESESARIARVENAYFDRLKDFAQQRLNLTVSSENNNINQLESQVSTEINVAQSVVHQIYGQAVYELEKLAEKAEAAEASEVLALKEELEKARKETSLEDKINRISAVLDAAAGVAGAATELVPYGRTVYDIICSLIRRK